MTAAAAIQAHLSIRLRPDGPRLSKQAVAELLGEDPSAWRRWVRGDVAPAASRVQAWAQAQGLRVYTTPDGWACESRT